MLVTEIITKKRDGCKLNEKEIAYLISSYNVGKLPDYQMAAFLMAVFFQGLDITETVLLTKALIDSGEKLDLSEVGGFVVDKHSSGGVGDKTTLVLAPLVAACGVKMAKMSGRGLGHTGGTIDKLNSIPGFRTALSMQEFIAIIKKCGVAISGQSADLTPADGKLYALRDVTGTVESIPLIASSIISKKIAAGAHGIILDVKIGSGAFMKSKEKAFELAEILVRIGQKLGRTVKVILTDMHQPLGYTIGNALEVKEAIRTLKGKGPEDLKKLVLELAKELLLIAGKTEEEAEALKIVEENLSNGSALAKFRQLVEAQGGDPRVLDDLRLLTSASFISSFKAEKQGYVQEIAADKIGRAAQLLGAGRLKKEDRIDPGAGIELCKKIGDYVQKGERLALLYTNRENSQGKALSLVKDAFTIGENFIQPPPLFYGKLG